MLQTHWVEKLRLAHQFLGQPLPFFLQEFQNPLSFFIYSVTEDVPIDLWQRAALIFSLHLQLWDLISTRFLSFLGVSLHYIGRATNPVPFFFLCVGGTLYFVSAIRPTRAGRGDSRLQSDRWMRRDNEGQPIGNTIIEGLKGSAAHMKASAAGRQRLECALL